MQIDIQARQFSLTDSIRTHVLERLGLALGRRYESIKCVHVKLSDINGPRGGKDKRCLIHVILPRLKNVVIEYTESSLYVAIDRAAERASRVVSQRLAQQRNKVRVPLSYKKHILFEFDENEYAEVK